jgi:hypothetical protein
LKRTSLPTDRAEATAKNSVIGKARSVKTRRIISPTIPVTPTTATFILNALFVIKDASKLMFFFSLFER